MDSIPGMSEFGAALDEARLRRLLDVGRSIVSELELEAVLESVLEAARDITGARYAALGVLNQDGDGLEQFLTSGIDEQTRAQIGDLPQGNGVLGVLISDPRPLRLADVGSHPRSYGFPAGHPPMTTFLGVPVRIRDSVFGNLYLTEKQDGEFTAADEQALVVLAEWAGFAIENARLYREATERRGRARKGRRRLRGGARGRARRRRRDAARPDPGADRQAGTRAGRARARCSSRSSRAGAWPSTRSPASWSGRSSTRWWTWRARRRRAFSSGRGRCIWSRGARAAVRVVEGIDARAALLVPLTFRGTVCRIAGRTRPGVRSRSLHGR